MRDSNEYEGWTNYATWYVYQHGFKGVEGFIPELMTAGGAREEGEKAIIGSLTNDTIGGLACGMAFEFIADVDWHQIASAYNNRTKE